MEVTSCLNERLAYKDPAYRDDARSHGQFSGLIRKRMDREAVPTHHKVSAYASGWRQFEANFAWHAMRWIRRHGGGPVEEILISLCTLLLSHIGIVWKFPGAVGCANHWLRMHGLAPFLLSVASLAWQRRSSGTPTKQVSVSSFGGACLRQARDNGHTWWMQSLRTTTCSHPPYFDICTPLSWEGNAAVRG